MWAESRLSSTPGLEADWTECWPWYRERDGSERGIETTATTARAAAAVTPENQRRLHCRLDLWLADNTRSFNELRQAKLGDGSSRFDINRGATTWPSRASSSLKDSSAVKGCSAKIFFFKSRFNSAHHLSC